MHKEKAVSCPLLRRPHGFSAYLCSGLKAKGNNRGLWVPVSRKKSVRAEADRPARPRSIPFTKWLLDLMIGLTRKKVKIRLF
ncbi:hypothetical protein HMPREF9136_0700 [Prevotella dentalis DSM 3688]|uniref:Uncharacterized protein n=1 Tax=Prevotella dentalis (strain ATCC 49559 / DSM 3688 / JCM 13448 / NCTC 12043 / ES 2772) TaxID=908937 RepID=F9D1H2_PREDD|nr:hypothetical protein HMPREF9136_0700 [Prevotella dentalis DSM 3688]